MFNQTLRQARGNKGLAPIIIILIAAVVIATAASGYFWWKNKVSTQPIAVNNEVSAPTSSAQLNAPSSSVDTSTWQTYRNGKYGFEFRYPAGYSASDVDPSSVMDATDTLLAVVAINEPRSEPFTYRVEVYSNKDSLGLDKWFEIYKLESIYQDPDLIASQSRLGGYNAKRWESNSATKLGTFAPKDNLVFGLEWLGYSSSDTRNIQIYQNILSTFKFTK